MIAARKGRLELLWHGWLLTWLKDVTCSFTRGPSTWQLDLCIGNCFKEGGRSTIKCIFRCAVPLEICQQDTMPCVSALGISVPDILNYLLISGVTPWSWIRCEYTYQFKTKCKCPSILQGCCYWWSSRGRRDRIRPYRWAHLLLWFWISILS